jgi:hypothetical protein
MNDDMNLEELKKWWDTEGKKIPIVLGLLSLVVAVVCIAIGFYEWHDAHDTLNGSKSLNDWGSFGSFLQGTTGSLWTLAGCIAAFLAFLIQTYQVAEQRKQFKIQSDSVTRQDFEARFFGLLDYHRQNVSEVGLNDKSGRRVFVTLIREFRVVHEIVERICDDSHANYPRLKRLELAYLAFYYGVGPNSTRLLKEVADPSAATLVEKLVVELELIQKYARTEKYKNSDTYGTDSDRLKKILTEIQKRITYIPFDGHQSRLGHYYRHMFQLVAFLDQKSPDKSQKEFAGIFRAQLTNHEQALLCLNALSTVGSPWITRGYLVNYELIKNIPKSFFDPLKEFDVKARFPQITFEYERANDPARDTNP